MMLGLFSRLRSRPAPAPRRRVSLLLERLEGRDCPSAPSFFFNANILTERTVVLYGMCSDEHPGSVTLTFTGAASATTTTNENGDFSVTTQANGLGTVTGVAVNQLGQSSTPQTDQIWSANPMIAGLSVDYGERRTVTITGTVMDEDPAGRVVTLSGKVNGSAVSDATGQFTLTAVATGLGGVTASVVDPWALFGSATLALTSNAPVIEDLVAIEGISRIWTFRGRVVDESPAGLEVVFSGLPSVANKKTTVQDDGMSFSFTVQLQNGEEGTVGAHVTDWWGLASDEVFTHVHQTN